MEASKLIKNTLALPQLWGVIIPMHLFGAWAIYQLFSGNAPAWWWIAGIVGYFVTLIVGIASGYHRLFCHRGYKVSKLTKRIILWCGVIAGQGSPIMWCSIHRGYHHRYADTPKDLHSPNDGFWHSYILWMFKYSKISVRSTVDLQRDPDILFAHKYYIPIVWVSHLVVALISFDLWLYLMLLPAMITLHCFLAQTSLTHCRFLGYRNYDVKDNSVNVPWLFPFILGEAWHNNHHAAGKNPNYRRRWWELDPAYWFIQLVRTHEKSRTD